MKVKYRGGSVEVKQMSNGCQLLHISKISDERETKSVKRMLMMLVRKKYEIFWRSTEFCELLYFMENPAAPTLLVTVRCQTLYLLEILA